MSVESLVTIVVDDSTKKYTPTTSTTTAVTPKGGPSRSSSLNHNSQHQQHPKMKNREGTATHDSSALEHEEKTGGGLGEDTNFEDGDTGDNSNNNASGKKAPVRRRSARRMEIAPGVELSKGGKRLIARLLTNDNVASRPIGIGVTRESAMHIVKPKIRSATFGTKKRVLCSGITAGLSSEAPACTSYTPSLAASLSSRVQPQDGTPTGDTFSYSSCFTGSDTGRMPSPKQRHTTQRSRQLPQHEEMFPGKPLTPSKGIVSLAKSALSDRFGPTQPDFHESKEEYMTFMAQRRLEREMFEAITQRTGESGCGTLPPTAKQQHRDQEGGGFGGDSHLSSITTTTATSPPAVLPQHRRTGRIPKRCENSLVMGNPPHQRGRGRFDGWTSRSVIIEDPNAKSALQVSSERLSRPYTSSSVGHHTSTTGTSHHRAVSPVAEEERHERLYGFTQRRLHNSLKQNKKRAASENSSTSFYHPHHHHDIVPLSELQKIIDSQFVEREEVRYDKSGRPLSPPKHTKASLNASGVERAKALLMGIPVPGNGKVGDVPPSVERVAKVAAMSCASLSTPHKLECPQCSTNASVSGGRVSSPTALAQRRAYSSNGYHQHTAVPGGRPPLSTVTTTHSPNRFRLNNSTSMSASFGTRGGGAMNVPQSRSQSAMSGGGGGASMMISSPTLSSSFMTESNSQPHSNKPPATTELNDSIASKKQERRGVGARTKGSQYSFGDTPFGMAVGESVAGGVMAPQKLPTPQEQEEAWRLRRLEAHTPFQSHQLLLSKSEREAPNAQRKRRGEEGEFLKKNAGVGGGKVGTGGLRQYQRDVQTASSLAIVQKEQVQKMEELAEEAKLKKAEEGRSLLQQRIDGQLGGGNNTDLLDGGTAGVYRIVRKQPQQQHNQTTDSLDNNNDGPPQPPLVTTAKRGEEVAKEVDEQIVQQYDGWNTSKYSNTMLVACSFGSAGNQNNRYHISDRQSCFNSKGAIATAGLGDATLGAGSRGARYNAATSLPTSLQPDEGGFTYQGSTIPRVDHQRQRRLERLETKAKQRDAEKQDQAKSNVSTNSSPTSRGRNNRTSSDTPIPTRSFTDGGANHKQAEAKQAALALSRGKGTVRGQSAILINMFGTPEDLDADQKVIEATRELLRGHK